MLFKKVSTSLFLVVLFLLAALSGWIYKTDLLNISANYAKSNTVIIDAGHGGFDGGAVAKDGTVEKDINLQIALRVAKHLEFNGYNVILTRSEDSGTEDNSNLSIPKRKRSDLENRLNVMCENRDAVFVSIHLNKFTTSAASGAQVFYSKNYDEARVLAQSIQDNIVALLQPLNDRVIKQGSSSAYLLKNAKVPAVIVECGFLSNSIELEKLKSVEYQSQMAFAISGGIINFYKEF